MNFKKSICCIVVARSLKSKIGNDMLYKLQYSVALADKSRKKYMFY